ncbi:hypothetical protein B7H23_01185 [Notoacmeibacter marinus]|uniref:Methyltransferase domain-containing protein n=1 Tax=Notoacmeibacter marinus TaxID=1876515 RepID=A0A231V211_9HYPH|nr:class I SAM-dependent methyltransferase [Notoacmeibacter marinus]OXT01616.1 hypothetical protein B7H23_01185 [Notoacmeibacter marinus]
MIVEKASLEHFDTLFGRSPDPWGTRSKRSEGFKRGHIVRMLGPHSRGRILELACGNGSNSQALAARGLRLTACDGSPAALERASESLTELANVDLFHLVLPGRFPTGPFDAIIIAELLYYLDDRTLNAVMSEIDRNLRPGGSLILCHHHRQFGDALQQQTGLHERFLRRSVHRWVERNTQRTMNWSAVRLDRPLR